MPGTVLVTGGFGLVGSATVRRLCELGCRVVIADLDTPANRTASETLPAGATAQWADLTDADQTGRLVAAFDPEVIIHLASVIPPGLYKNRAPARRCRRGHGYRPPAVGRIRTGRVVRAPGCSS